MPTGAVVSPGGLLASSAQGGSSAGHGIPLAKGRESPAAAWECLGCLVLGSRCGFGIRSDPSSAWRSQSRAESPLILIRPPDPCLASPLEQGHPRDSQKGSSSSSSHSNFFFLQSWEISQFDKSVPHYSNQELPDLSLSEEQTGVCCPLPLLLWGSFPSLDHPETPSSKPGRCQHHPQLSPVVVVEQPLGLSCLAVPSEPCKAKPLRGYLLVLQPWRAFTVSAGRAGKSPGS